jgi:hypothetical protein
MEVNGQLHAPAVLLPGKESPDTYWIGGWVSPRVGRTLWRRKNLARTQNQTQAVQSVAIPIELSRNFVIMA